MMDLCIISELSIRYMLFGHAYGASVAVLGFQAQLTHALMVELRIVIKALLRRGWPQFVADDGSSYPIVEALLVPT